MPEAIPCHQVATLAYADSAADIDWHDGQHGHYSCVRLLGARGCADYSNTQASPGCARRANKPARPEFQSGSH